MKNLKKYFDFKTSNKSALKLAIFYAIFSAIYIAYSDHLVSVVFSDPEQIAIISTIKGWAFVAITAILIYIIVSIQIESSVKLIEIQNQITQEKLRAMVLLDSIAANSSDAIFAKDLSGKYLLFNRAASKLTGKEIDLVIGHDDSLLFPAEQAIQIMANDQKVINENKIIASIEAVSTVDGDKLYHATKGPLHDEKGNIIGIFGISRDITDFVKTEIQLKQKSQLLVEMSKMAKIGGWQFDIATQTGTWTDEIASIHDIEATEEISVEYGLSVFNGDNRKKIESAINIAIDSGQAYDLELEMVTHKNNKKWVRTLGMPIFKDNKVVSLHGFMQDITEKKLIEQKLRLWAEAFENAGFGLSITNAITNTFVSVNPTFAKQRGYRIEELLGMPKMMVFPPEIHEEVTKQIQKIENDGKGIFESVHIRKDGSSFPVLIDITVIKTTEGIVQSRLSYVMDISERKKSEEKIYRLAHYDSVTNLPNRLLLTERIEELCKHPSRDNLNFLFIIINIDHFKAFNDARGHISGDLLLVIISDRIVSLLNSSDTIARISGDEFAILLNNNEFNEINNANFPIIRINEIQNILRQPFDIGGEEIYITTSIGITLCSGNALDDVENILKRADTALNKAKQSGGDQIVFFEKTMAKAAENYFTINSELHKSIRSNDLKIYLQSQVDANGKIVGAEALLRWDHPKKGLIAPAAFICIAEDSDLIVDIENWVLNQVCHILNLKIMAESNLRISINISPRHFRQANFVEGISKIFTINDTKPERVTLEVTEGLIIENIDDVVTKMLELSALGFNISIDDFGTGYSSLSYIKKLPIQELKIDKIFIQDAPVDPDDAAIVETILAVAKQLKLNVVAEGVQTKEQAEFLNSRAAVIHQGYLYGQPIPAEEWLKNIETN